MTMTDNKDDEMDWLECLQHKEATCVYLQAVLDDYQQSQDRRMLCLALKNVVKARGGVTRLAKKANLRREHLSHLLAGRSSPKLETIMAILRALDFRLCVRVYHSSQPIDK